jgi:alanine dehydrogenase
MRVGIPRETGDGEGRVAAAPSAVRTLAAGGHEVWVEQAAGEASGFPDHEYIRAGATIAPTAEECFDRAELVWKVGAPDPHESTLLRPGHVVAALLHAAEPAPWRGVALERARARDGSLPVLASMSEIAGRLAVDAATVALASPSGGRGILLGGVPGVQASRVVVLGAGVAGTSAARVASAVGADVQVLDVDVARLRALRVPGVRTLLASAHEVEGALVHADVVIAAVRDDGPRCPLLATRAHLSLMQPGAVVVDLSIVDGGAFESTPVTTLDAPAQVVDGIVHIGVPNFAGGVPRTASLALSQSALPFVLALLAGA